MTELEYIQACDLRTVRHLLALIREVIPENNDAIPLKEYQTVTRILSSWQDTLFATINIQPAQET